MSSDGSSTGPGQLTSLDYVPTKEEAILLRENADKFIDTVLNELANNKVLRDEGGVLYEVTHSPTLLSSEIFQNAGGDGWNNLIRTNSKGERVAFPDDTEDIKFRVGEANNIVVNLQSMFDKYFDDIPVKRVAQDAIWRDLLQHHGYNREDLPSELKYLYDKPKGYYHWETDKRMMYEEWVTYTADMKENYGGDFHQFFEEYKKSGKKSMGKQKDYQTSEIIDIYEALDRV